MPTRRLSGNEVFVIFKSAYDSVYEILGISREDLAISVFQNGKEIARNFPDSHEVQIAREIAEKVRTEENTFNGAKVGDVSIGISSEMNCCKVAYDALNSLRCSGKCKGEYGCSS